YGANSQTNTYGDLARAVISTAPDAILAVGSTVAQELKAATESIPIVAIVADPVASGLVSSLARPGGNLTGAPLDGGLELHAKRLELLVELRAHASRVGYLSSSRIWRRSIAIVAREAAQRLSITLTHLDLGDTLNAGAYRAAFGAMDGKGIEALLVSD